MTICLHNYHLQIHIHQAYTHYHVDSLIIGTSTEWDLTTELCLLHAMCFSLHIVQL